MVEIKALIRLFDTGYILRVFMLLLLYAVLPILEMALILHLSNYIDSNILIACVTAGGLVGIVLGYLQVRKMIERLKGMINEGMYPEEGFFHLFGALLAGILLILPGFLSDTVGLLLFVPAVRILIGRMLTRKMEPSFKALYEYLKLYELG